MTFIIIVLLSIPAYMVLKFVLGLSCMALAGNNPTEWRRMMEKQINEDTMKFYKSGIDIQNAHTTAIKIWYNKILKLRNHNMYQLFNEMMQDEFPKQIEMYNKQIYGENYKSSYAFIKNNEEMLEIIKSERAASGSISNLEKVYLDRAMLVSLSMDNEEEINESIPSILVGFEEVGLPTTYEEVHTYISERLDIKLKMRETYENI